MVALQWIKRFWVISLSTILVSELAAIHNFGIYAQNSAELKNKFCLSFSKGRHVYRKWAHWLQWQRRMF